MSEVDWSEGVKRSTGEGGEKSGTGHFDPRHSLCLSSYLAISSTTSRSPVLLPSPPLLPSQPPPTPNDTLPSPSVFPPEADRIPRSAAESRPPTTRWTRLPRGTSRGRCPRGISVGDTFTAHSPSSHYFFFYFYHPSTSMALLLWHYLYGTTYLLRSRAIPIESTPRSHSLARVTWVGDRSIARGSLI